MIYLCLEYPEFCLFLILVLRLCLSFLILSFRRFGSFLGDVFGFGIECSFCACFVMMVFAFFLESRFGGVGILMGILLRFWLGFEVVWNLVLWLCFL